jgi:hypothetical protein
MSPLEKALAKASRRIADFLAQDLPTLGPVSQALSQAASFLPCTDPSPEQRAALREYRKSLEALQAGIPDVTGRLQSKRTSVLAKLKNLKAARAYQESTQF